MWTLVRLAFVAVIYLIRIRQNLCLITTITNCISSCDQLVPCGLITTEKLRGAVLDHVTGNCCDCGTGIRVDTLGDLLIRSLPEQSRIL